MSHAVLERPPQKPSPRSSESSESSPDLQSNQNNVPPGRRGWLRTTLAWIAGSVPTVLVLALLAGVGFYGHHSDWKLPKFSTLAGAEPAPQADWCEEHGVPESNCVECNPNLMPKSPDHGWCVEHGVHNCPLHHPEVAQVKDTPTVAEADLERAARALALADRKASNAVCTMHLKRIQFASVDAVQQAGVDVELVGREPISESVAGNGEIRYDPTRLASLSSRVPGTVWRVEKTIGDVVREGEVLAIVDAANVGQAKSRLMQALAEQKLQQQNVTRLKEARGAVPGRAILDAEAALAKAQAAVLSAEQSLVNLGLPVDADRLQGLSEHDVLAELRFLGLPESVRSNRSQRTATANLVPVLSPMDGVVVERNVTAGEVVDESHKLFQVADTSRMWLILNVPLENASQLSVGQTVRFRPDGSRGEVSGKLDWISTAADRQTRMVQVRAELPNPDGHLRDETFGTGHVVLREEEDAIVVPSEAVHWEGCCQIVFVRDKHYFDSPESPKVFHVRTVRTGAKTDDVTEIIAGVLPGEVVTTTGGDVLRAQLLKNNLGAGCCGEE